MIKRRKHPNKCPICRRSTHRKSKYCIFHASAEEKTEKEFKGALKEYIQKIKEEDRDYYFKDFIFVGDIDFRKDLGIISFKNANFNDTTFKGSADFSNLDFEGEGSFRYTTFEVVAMFKEATFKGNYNFQCTTFNDTAVFWNAYFEVEIDFRCAIFNLYTDFCFAIFNKKADFGGAIFKGRVDFNDAIFNGNTIFNETIFKSDVGFLAKTIKGELDFSSAIFSHAKTLHLSIIGRIKINFKKTYLENVFLDLNLDKGVLIDFTETLLRNTKFTKNEIEIHILQERKKEFDNARDVYLLLKNNFHSIGQYEDESWAYKKEKDMERKSYFHFKSLHKWLWSYFLNALYGYGEKPGRVIVSAIAIIIIFAFVFMNFGIDANPQLDTIPKYNILKELFIGIRYGDLLVRLKDISLEQIKNCLYFSTVTFTTLGLGDFRPIEGWGRIFVATEAFIGALMMALLVYTFARRTGGR